MARKAPRSNYPYPDKKLTKNSNGMILLHFAISLKRPFTLEDIKYMSPAKFSKFYVSREYLQQLATWGLVTDLGNDTFQITEEGIQYAHVVANYYRQFEPSRTADRAYA